MEDEDDIAGLDPVIADSPRGHMEGRHVGGHDVVEQRTQEGAPHCSSGAATTGQWMKD